MAVYETVELYYQFSSYGISVAVEFESFYSSTCTNSLIYQHTHKIYISGFFIFGLYLSFWVVFWLGAGWDLYS